MVPALWVPVESLPLTANGKVDKKALPEPNIAEKLSHQYLAPRNEFETILTAIWQELLQVDKVGIHDNFFELGGDSIITIQVVSRAKRSGYLLKPKDLFIHQTIAKLSAALSVNQVSELSISAEQGVLTGLAGLLPIQQWYFEKEPLAISHFNQSVLLGIDKGITENMLEASIEQIMMHHDALRFTYYQKDENWYQEYSVYKGGIITEDLQLVTDGSLGTLINERATVYQRSLNIEKGELIKVVLMKTPQSEVNNRLFIVIHHLGIDGVSWRILLEDFELLLTELSINRKTINLGSKTSSYRQWYNALNQYGQSNRLLSQKSYWQNIVKGYLALPVDKDFNEKISVNDTCTYSVRLGAEQTRQLLQDVPRVFHTEINDILLCALAKTLCEWSDTDHVVIGLEGHGREHVAEGIDTSRTVGWFTSLFPVLLNGNRDKNAGDLIKTIKEQLRLVPDKGLGYGVLKYINHEQTLQGKEPWDILFNYLGQIDNVIKENKWFSVVEESAGAGVSGEQVVTEKFNINSYIRSAELVVNWTYSKSNYEEETIKRITEAYIKNLQVLIKHSIEQGKSSVIFTPSDYGLGGEITYEELDAFLEEDNSDNIMSF
jgi:non-ribosomal peptide synthase protein (TIGR01720 family)